MARTLKRPSGKPPTLEEAKRIIAVVESLGVLKDAAKTLGYANPRGLQFALASIKKRHGLEPSLSERLPDATLPGFPPGDIPYSERRELQGRSFEARKESWSAHTWFEIKHNDTLPIGYAFVGDPHGDDDGHHVKQFDEDMKALAKAEGVYAVNMGDLTNAWPEGGKLAGKYADQSMSRKDAINFIRWHLCEIGVPWRLLILGNHDAWNPVMQELIREIVREEKVIVHKWDARFVLVFPNGRRCFVKAAHNYKGHSWFHELHGNIRSFLDCPAHIVVAAHHHDWGTYAHEAPNIAHLMNPGLPFVAHLLRVRGYKHMDDYALTHDFPDYQEGATALAIVDPEAKTGMEFVEIDMNLQRGLRRLAKMRKERARVGG